MRIFYFKNTPSHSILQPNPKNTQHAYPLLTRLPVEPVAFEFLFLILFPFKSTDTAEPSSLPSRLFALLIKLFELTSRCALLLPLLANWSEAVGGGMICCCCGLGVSKNLGLVVSILKNFLSFILIVPKDETELFKFLLTTDAALLDDTLFIFVFVTGVLAAEL